MNLFLSIFTILASIAIPIGIYIRQATRQRNAQHFSSVCFRFDKIHALLNQQYNSETGFNTLTYAEYVYNKIQLTIHVEEIVKKDKTLINELEELFEEIELNTNIETKNEKTEVKTITSIIFNSTNIIKELAKHI